MHKIMLRKRKSFKGIYWNDNQITEWLIANGVKSTFLSGKLARCSPYDVLPAEEVSKHLVIRESKKITLELTATVSKLMQSGFYTVIAN